MKVDPVSTRPVDAPISPEPNPPRLRGWPIIGRELRAESRHLSNYWLRITAAAILAALLAMLIQSPGVPFAFLSIRLFTGAHTILLGAIWLIGPLLTCDAIGRERRNGTLSLLFSTGLTPRSIVLGKSFVHLIRLATLWLAAFPILTVAVLLGGVASLDVWSAFLIEACAGLWALGAGLVVSAFVCHPAAAFLLAEAAALILIQLLRMTLGWAWLHQVRLPTSAAAFLSSQDSLPRFALSLCTGQGTQLGWSRQGDPVWAAILVEMVLVSLLAFWCAIALAAWQTNRIWCGEPLSTRQLRRRQTWLAPRFHLPRLMRIRRRWLDRNPLGWLHQSSVWPRVAKLSWVALILLVDSLVILSSHPWDYFDAPQSWISILLSLHITLVSVTVFRREKDSGSLELLLVTPMSVRKIIGHELCGVWRRFLLPVFLFAGLYELIVQTDMASPSEFSLRTFVLVNYLFTPIIGFFAAARFDSFAAAFILTALFSLILPLFGPGLGSGFMEDLALMDVAHPPGPTGGSALQILLANLPQATMAFGAWCSLQRLLVRRQFSFGRLA